MSSVDFEQVNVSGVVTPLKRSPHIERSRAEAYLGPCQISVNELFMKIVNGCFP